MTNIFGGVSLNTGSDRLSDYSTRPPDSGLKSVKCPGCETELTTALRRGNKILCPFCGKRLEYQISKSHEREP